MIIHQIEIDGEMDILLARQKAREASKTLNFSLVDQTRIITVVSELSRNIYEYAGKGQVTIEEIFDNFRHGIQITFADKGPGIAIISLAMKEGYSSGGGMGFGLSGSKKLMDEFYIYSEPGKGTKVIVKKWL